MKEKGDFHGTVEELTRSVLSSSRPQGLFTVCQAQPMSTMLEYVRECLPEVHNDLVPDILICMTQDRLIWLVMLY